MHGRQFLAVLCLAVAQTVGATTVPDLYAAAVPVTDRSEEARLQAFKDALASVLVKVTGDLGVTGNPGILDLLEQAPLLLQQYRYTEDSEIWAAFDGSAVEGMLRQAGLPVWGDNRPLILMWLAVDWGGGSRGLITAGEETELRKSIEKVASSRGLPIVWPLFDSTDRAAMTFSDLWGGFSENIEAASARYDAGAVLVGRASRGEGPGLFVRWKLEIGDLKDEWRGGLSDGIHRVADTLGQRFAARGTETHGAVTSVAVAGIRSLRDYAQVSGYLERLSLVRHVAVGQVAADTVIFELELQGDASRLPNIIDLDRTLRPLAIEESQGIALGAQQRYQFNP